MATEVWFRNPNAYVRELAEVGHFLIAWDRGMLFKRSIDPVAFANLHMPPQWRSMIIGAQGSMEIDAEHGPLNPVAVYPTWCYGQPQALLEEMIANPAGEDRNACFDTSIAVDERPVWGQKHMVVIAEGPPGGAGNLTGRKFYKFLHDLKQDNPDCLFYVHGLYSFNFMFGLGFDAVDFEPRQFAQKGRVVTASGSIVAYEQAQKHPKWLHAVGMSVKDIEVPRNRCIFNIKSTLWAAEHYSELFNFRISRTGTKVDSITPEIEHKPDGTKRFLTINKRPKPGDQLACDQCSLRDVCKYEREGAVCSVPDSDGSQLAKYFRTRDSSLIVDGLTTLLGMQAERLEDAREVEKIIGDLDPEVSKLMSQLFTQGVTLAKLVDPTLRSGPKVAVNVSNGNAQIEVGNTKQIVARVVAELESSGIPRDKITPEMVEGVLANAANRGRAISGTVLSERDENYGG